MTSLIFWTTSIPRKTLPKTVCLLSSHDFKGGREGGRKGEREKKGSEIEEKAGQEERETIAGRITHSRYNSDKEL